MSIVISDASCLILFTNIDRLDILSSLFGEIWITSAVQREYRLVLPEFVSVHDAIDRERSEELQQILDPGEATSIALALENPGCTILIDEKKGRRVATSLGIEVTGTVGILLKAAAANLVEVRPDLISDLEANGFYLSDRLLDLLSK